MNHRSVGVVGLGLILYATVSSAQDFGRYRGFELESAVAVVSTLTGVAGSELKAIHQRPAVIQQLTWRPRYAAQRAPDTESVDQMVFDFYNDRLFRVTVDYERKQTEGLVDADMIEAISAIYGSPVKPLVTRRAQPAVVGVDDVTQLAQWGNAVNSVRLQRLSSYATSFRLVLTAESVATLARTAAVQAVALDAREAPQREAAREKTRADDLRAAQEKARSTNKAAFRP